METESDATISGVDDIATIVIVAAAGTMVLVLALAIACWRKRRQSNTPKSVVSVESPAKPSDDPAAQQSASETELPPSYFATSEGSSGTLRIRKSNVMPPMEMPPTNMPPKRGTAARADADDDDEMNGIVTDGDDGEVNLKPKVRQGRGSTPMAAADDDDDGMQDSAEGVDGVVLKAHVHAHVRRGRGSAAMAAANDDEEEMYYSGGGGEGGLNVRLPARDATAGGDGEVMGRPVHRGAGKGKQSTVDDDDNLLDNIAGGDGELMAAPVHRGRGKAALANIDADDGMGTLDHTEGELSLREVSMKISASQSMMHTRGHNGVVRKSGVLDGGDIPDAPPTPMRRSMSMGSKSMSMSLGQIVSTGGSTFEGLSPGRAQISPMCGSLAAIAGTASVTADGAEPSARLRGRDICGGSFLFRLRLWLRGTPTERGLRLPNGRKPRSDRELQLAIGQQIQAAARHP